MNPICVKCGKPMFCRKTGRVLAEYHADGEVFRLRSVDEYACHYCDAVVCLVESEPFAERGRISTDERSIDVLLALAEQRQNLVRVVYGEGSPPVRRLDADKLRDKLDRIEQAMVRVVELADANKESIAAGVIRPMAERVLQEIRGDAGDKLPPLPTVLGPDQAAGRQGRRTEA